MTVPTGPTAERRGDGAAVEVVDGGPFTTVQDLPGRIGYWHVGVPPNGPMDDLVAPARRTGCVGNADGAAALELTGGGPTLRFTARRRVAHRRGGDADDGRRPSRAAVGAGRGRRPGATVASARRTGPGLRATLAVRGGFDAEPLPRQPLDVHARPVRRPRGSGRCAAGDVLRVGRPTSAGAAGDRSPPGMAPDAGHDWELGVLVGPHAAPGVPHRRPGSTRCCAPTGRCTSTRRAPACAWSARSPRGRGPTAARPGCTRRTSTTPATRSARSTSPATCR